MPCPRTGGWGKGKDHKMPSKKFAGPSEGGAGRKKGLGERNSRPARAIFRNRRRDFLENTFGFYLRPGAYYYILDFPLRFPPRRFAARRQNGANFRDIFRPQGEKNLTNNKVKIYGQIFSLRQKINR